jgi:S-methylmethionine-dependent homocysteine/selenocysteine methylase
MSKITLLDGGMGQELVKRSGVAPTPLWSAQIMMDQPELVSGVYEDFIRAGARVITVNNYTISRPRLARDGEEKQFEALHRKALEIVTAARDASLEKVFIAGTLAPLVGSYVPDQTPPFEECLKQYREIIALQEEHVDLLMAETMCCETEAVAATVAMVESGKPSWCALTVNDHDGKLLRSGERVSDVAQKVKAAGASAVLLNCSYPEAITTALAELTELGLPIGGYANAFTSVAALSPGGTVAALSARADLSPEKYADFAMQWVALGARIVGGCCEVGPAHIAEIKTRLTAAGHEIIGLHS